MDYRIGFSKDIHRLVENRKLIIGGVVVPFEKGELAHSDGDVLYHALAESILGALALGDLGKHFPDTSSETKDMDSGVIVSKVVSLEKPKLKYYIELMRKNVASLLEVDIDYVSIKAGTNEKMGPVGLGEAIEASSIILLKKVK